MRQRSDLKETIIPELLEEDPSLGLRVYAFVLAFAYFSSWFAHLGRPRRDGLVSFEAFERLMLRRSMWSCQH